MLSTHTQKIGLFAASLFWNSRHFTFSFYCRPCPEPVDLPGFPRLSLHLFPQVPFVLEFTPLQKSKKLSVIYLTANGFTFRSNSFEMNNEEELSHLGLCFIMAGKTIHSLMPVHVIGKHLRSYSQCQNRIRSTDVSVVVPTNTSAQQKKYSISSAPSHIQ